MKQAVGIHINKRQVWEYFLITVSTFLIMIGSHYFKFPNNFTFGGITGLSVVIGKIATILLSFGLTFLDKYSPVNTPLTDEPFLELVFAIVLPSVRAAILFNIGASGGGTDVIALILKKHTSVNIGMALIWTDLLITLSTILVFDMKTFLFSLLGMVTKSLAIDNVIENINLCKYFNVVCSEPQDICNFITNTLNRSATICHAEGAFTHEQKYIVMTVLKRSQAVMLRRYVKSVEPSAFIMITSTSEIIGKGFMG